MISFQQILIGSLSYRPETNVTHPCLVNILECYKGNDLLLLTFKNLHIRLVIAELNER